ncbi:DUF695 domain-containing protein [Rufibacter sp. XAAS-G3-1]|uniref:DUF695 domain-containing protein n=1 Tax=Rufibacter sp. XAAS-G3-1 TaxID=2729134 RepID=UPI0015E792F0|nr:DUF695 domain-containing protein [Rufibacter sp. XAAS-G3-1]
METNEYQPDWEVYFCQIEHNPAFIGVDLNLQKMAPVETQNKVIEVTVPLASPGEDGFPAESEWEALGQIEDALADTLETNLEAVFVGKTLNAGLRKFYFYAEEVLLAEHYLSQVRESFPGYQFEADIWEDPEWETYLEFLFPEPMDLQKIRNGKVLRQLEENGDNPAISRQVTHFVYFQDEASREKFWAGISAQGYQKVEERFDPDSEETPYILQVARETTTEQEAINEVVLSLWHLAQQYNAAYDGWETSIETGDAAS